MPLLQEYTLSFVDRDCDKVCIDFADPSPSDYEQMELIRFFRKYKQETFIEHKGNQFFFLVVKWEHWVEFLFYLGFEETARVVGEILNDLEQNYEITMGEYIDQLKKAKPIKDFYAQKSVVKEVRDEDEYDRLKLMEIHRLRTNKLPEEEIELPDFNIRKKLKALN